MITLDRLSRLHPIVTVSQDGFHSALAMMSLQLMGYNSVRSLDGGMDAFQQGE